MGVGYLEYLLAVEEDIGNIFMNATVVNTSQLVATNQLHKRHKTITHHKPNKKE